MISNWYIKPLEIVKETFSVRWIISVQFTKYSCFMHILFFYDILMGIDLFIESNLLFTLNLTMLIITFIKDRNNFHCSIPISHINAFTFSSTNAVQKTLKWILCWHCFMSLYHFYMIVTFPHSFSQSIIIFA